MRRNQQRRWARTEGRTEVRTNPDRGEGFTRLYNTWKQGSILTISASEAIMISVAVEPRQAHTNVAIIYLTQHTRQGSPRSKPCFIIFCLHQQGACCSSICDRARQWRPSIQSSVVRTRLWNAFGTCFGSQSWISEPDTWAQFRIACRGQRPCLMTAAGGTASHFPCIMIYSYFTCCRNLYIQCWEPRWRPPPATVPHRRPGGHPI